MTIHLSRIGDLLAGCALLMHWFGVVVGFDVALPWLGGWVLWKLWLYDQGEGEQVQ